MQNALTVIVPIRSGHHVEELRSFLADMGTKISTRAPIDFYALPIHFARWVVIEASDPHPPLLVFGTDHDGADSALLEQMYEQAGETLSNIYSHCEETPEDLPSNKAAFVEYMLGHRVPYGARYVAYRNHSVQDVRNALLVRDTIEDYLDTRAPADTDSRLLAEEIVQFASARFGPSLVGSPRVLNSTIVRLTAAGLLIVWALIALGVYNGLLVLGLILLVLVSGALWWRRLRQAEEEDATDFTPPKAVIDAGSLILQENFLVQNQLTHIVPIKPGPLRLFTLKLVLWAINLLAEIHYTHGELGGIPTIHFARWMIIDGGERLLFFSNFDGSWERYLGDFVDKAHAGLTGVWSNTLGFPPAKNLIGEGATNVDVFKAWTRSHQIPTQVWYSAYPTSSVSNVRDSIAIRDAVAALQNAIPGTHGEAAARKQLEQL